MFFLSNGRQFCDDHPVIIADIILQVKQQRFKHDLNTQNPMTSEANILNKRGCSIVIISLQGEKDIN
jgi:hypothetical protein